MKEATGEASMTGITIAIIAVVAAIAIPIVNGLINNTKNSSCCASAGGTWYKNACYASTDCNYDEKTKKTTCSGSPFTPKCD